MDAAAEEEERGEVRENPQRLGRRHVELEDGCDSQVAKYPRQHHVPAPAGRPICGQEGGATGGAARAGRHRRGAKRPQIAVEKNAGRDRSVTHHAVGAPPDGEMRVRGLVYRGLGLCPVTRQVARPERVGCVDTGQRAS